MSRYILVDYEGGVKSEKPSIAFRTDDEDAAKNKVDELKEANVDRCVVLFDTEKGEVIKVVMLCEPIYLVLAVELARNEWVKLRKLAEWTEIKLVQGGASAVIGQIASRLSGGPVPGVGAAVLGHIIAPYFAVKGDGAKVAGAAAGMYGGLSGAILGFVVGGPIGAFIGGVVGGAGLGVGAEQLVRAVCHPDQCSKCKGAGLDEKWIRCSKCDGYGYTKAMN